MSLLVDMMTNTLDEAYADAARRRALPVDGVGPPVVASGEPGTARRVTAVVLVVALGLVTGTAAAQVRKRSSGGSGVRAGLIADVQRRTAQSDALAGQADRLRAQVARLRATALRSNAAGVTLAGQLADLELAVGVTPVVGPGLVVRLDDAPAGSSAAAGRGGQPGAGRVLDRDLQDAVNGLWAAGAEAVAVNGLRLSALTAIRSAGAAILVDYRPLSPPYTVQAIGAPGELAAGFADGAAGRRLSSYVSVYGLQMLVRRSDALTLPGAGIPTLRLARPEPARR